MSGCVCPWENRNIGHQIQKLDFLKSSLLMGIHMDVSSRFLNEDPPTNDLIMQSSCQENAFVHMGFLKEII